MRSFDELDHYLTVLHARGNIKKTAGIIQKLSDQFGNPEKKYPTIHVAGTNGKGSVSLKIAKAFELAGYRVGLYTSPHLHSLKERILVNKEPIAEDYFCTKIEELLEISNQQEEPLVFFELMTLLALQYFEKRAVDVAIIEAGVGGKNDFTNIIHPCLCVITSISLDHEDQLGKGLDAIAEHKAGIIKPNIPIVVGPRVNFPVIHERALLLNAPLFSVTSSSIFYDDENTEVAKLCLRILSQQFSLDRKAIEKGTVVRPECRFENRGKVIFDVAHNIDGLTKLLQAIESHFPDKTFDVLIGMSKDKDLHACLSIIAAKARKLHLVKLPSHRGANVEELSDVLIAQGFNHFQTYPSISEAVKNGHAESELLVVCGSFYLMTEAKAALNLII